MPQEPAPSGPGPRSEKVVTRIGSTVAVSGDLEGHEDMVVEGRFQGKITLPAGTLTVAARASVEADVKVRTALLHGAVKGTVRAAERAVLSETADVHGDIISPRITIADGCRFIGRLLTGGST